MIKTVMGLPSHTLKVCSVFFLVNENYLSLEQVLTPAKMITCTKNQVTYCITASSERHFSVHTHLHLVCFGFWHAFLCMYLFFNVFCVVFFLLKITRLIRA